MDANTFLTWMQEGYEVQVVNHFGLWEDGRSWTGMAECILEADLRNGAQLLPLINICVWYYIYRVEN